METRCLCIPMTFVLAVLAGCEKPDPLEANENTVRYPTHFTVGLTQANAKGEWKPVPIHDSQAELQAAPFRMIFFVEKPSELIIQASTNPAIQQAAKEGTSLNALLPAHAAIAEPMGNPKRRLWISDGAYQSWMILDEKTHRFDKEGVESLPEGGFLVRRTIENMSSGDLSTPVNQMGEKTLYLLLVQANKHPETGEMAEKQREWLTLKFIPASPPSTAPAEATRPRPLVN